MFHCAQHCLASRIKSYYLSTYIPAGHSTFTPDRCGPERAAMRVTVSVRTSSVALPWDRLMTSDGHC